MTIRWGTEHQEDDGLSVLNNDDVVNEVVLALDYVGYRIADREYPDMKFRLFGLVDHVPDWCEPDERIRLGGACQGEGRRALTDTDTAGVSNTGCSLAAKYGK